MKARLTATALALAWSGLILAACTERPTEPLATRNTVADVVPQGVALPVANAGADVSTYINEPVTLQGSATDPNDRAIVQWQWEVLWGPDGADLSDAWSNTTNFTGYLGGDYIVSLTACVDTGELELVCSSPDSVTVTVVNREPVAVITADKTTVTVGETVCFDGSQSFDPDNQSLSYLWTFDDGSETSDKMSPCHAFSYADDFDVWLTVFDGSLEGRSDILITVEGQPDPRDGIQSLISGIHSLVSNGQLSADRGDGLLSKLNGAITSLDNGQARDACKQLSAFQNQVRATIKAKKLTLQIGQALISATESIRTLIGCA
jgi:PKD domain-containing protein/K319-like protein